MQVSLESWKLGLDDNLKVRSKSEAKQSFLTLYILKSQLDLSYFIFTFKIRLWFLLRLGSISRTSSQDTIQGLDDSVLNTPRQRRW